MLSFTYGAYTTAEFSLLVLYTALQSTCILKMLDPKPTPYIALGQFLLRELQGSCRATLTNYQSLDTSPTFAKIISKTKDPAFSN